MIRLNFTILQYLITTIIHTAIALMSLWSWGQYSAGQQNITVSGRPVIVQTPSNYNSSKTYPVVFLLHGTGGDRTSLLNQSLVDKHQYIGVYPEGKTLLGVRYFNVYKSASLSTGVNDVNYLKTVYNTIVSNAKVHTDSVYAHGYSNGGIMAYKMARETNIFDGISIRSGGEEVGDNVGASAPKIPIIHIHGAKDKTVPYNGGKSNLAPPFGSLTNFKTTESTIKSWFLKNACNIRPSHKKTMVNAGTANQYELWEYYDCGNPRKKIMKFYKVTNGLHNTGPQGFAYSAIMNLSMDFFRKNK